MGVSKKHAKGRLDKLSTTAASVSCHYAAYWSDGRDSSRRYYHMAKEQGYRARSAFKLIQLNKKFAFLEKAKVLVDLCAAPGGWLQVAQKYMPKSSIIIGLDLAPIKPIPGVITHVEDITTPKCRSTLKSELKTWKADIFLHDGAPNVGVSWAHDAFMQNELTLSALKLASEFLIPNGVFITKVFRSKDYTKLLWVFNQLFNSVDATKPTSSRNVSAEIFVVCRGFKAPKKIDPKLLDSRHVFREVDDVVGDEDDAKKIKDKQNQILNDLLHPEKRKRHRDGYADGATILYTAVPVSKFIRSPDFLSILATSNALTIKVPAVEQEDEVTKADHATILSSPHTTPQILADIADLRTLGKKEFKGLMRWREAMRIVLGIDSSKEEIRKAKEEKARAEKELAEKEAASKGETEEDIANESAVLQSEQKKALRKSREKKAKQLLRLRLGMSAPMDIGLEADASAGGLDGLQFEDSVGESTPALRSTKRQSRPELNEDGSESESSEYDETESDFQDSEDDIEVRLGNIENEKHGLYEDYIRRKGERDPSIVVKQKNAGKAAFEEWYGIEWENKMQKLEKTSKPDGTGDSGSDDSDSSWGDNDDETDNRKRKNANDDVFESALGAADDGGLSSAVLSKKARVFFDNPLFKLAGATSGTFAEEITNVGDDDDDDAAISKANRDAKEKNSKNSKNSKSETKRSEKDIILSDSEDDRDTHKGFEIARTSKADEDFTQTKGFILDTAEKYSLAQKVVKKSGKRDVIDDAFNRYAYNDPENLPAWFTQEESRHNKIHLPVTKEAVEIMRQKLRAMDARPIKKVAEAKFRQRMRASNRLEKAKQKASAIADDEDTPEMSKMKDAARVMAKALKKKPKKETKVVVAKHANKGIKGRPKGVKGRYKNADK
ncbi:AdoMet-dependent rRNA methyltransferase spb1 [Entophlyctis luteolus]|nr:AdoMet-dependent rRNA methyltransferase spb1 [Entophlyctis luteolus]